MFGVLIPLAVAGYGIYAKDNRFVIAGAVIFLIDKMSEKTVYGEGSNAPVSSIPTDTDGEEITRPPQYFIHAADVLDEALLKNMTEDEAAVYGVFENMENDADIFALITAFGRREKYWTFGVTYSLPEAIRATMSAGEVKQINTILKKAGIKYRF